MADKTTPPIILIIFNRPDTTAQVVSAIAKAKPETLLVVADGPRPDHPEDVESCRQARAVVEAVDWKCPVQTHFGDTNMGLKDRVSTGIAWAFEQVDRAIILEDDCIPEPSFFPFCSELLARFEDDQRIMAIAGDNFQFGRRRTNYSYYFSVYPHCWGWATWRRAWRHYDHNISLWPEIRDGGWLHDMLMNEQAERYWTKALNGQHSGQGNSWASRWTFCCWLQNGLTVLPNVNLVSNIGHREDGTHTRDPGSKVAALAAEPLQFPLKHPPYVVRDTRADAFTAGILYRSPGMARKLAGRARRTLQRRR